MVVPITMNPTVQILMGDHMWYALIHNGTGEMVLIGCLSPDIIEEASIVPSPQTTTEEDEAIASRLIRGALLSAKKITRAEALSFAEMELAPVVSVSGLIDVLKEQYPDDWEHERKWLGDPF